MTESNHSYPEIVGSLLEYLAKTGVLTDTNPGSVVRTLIEAFARELYEAYVKLDYIHDMAFIDTATDSALDRLVAILGADRVDGAIARGEVVFTRDPRVSGLISLPKDTELLMINSAMDKRVVYKTIESMNFPNGQSEISVPVMSPIPQGVAKETILIADDEVRNQAIVVNMVKAIAGISSVVILEATVKRGFREEDQDLRQRVKGLIEAAGGGTAKAIEQAVLATGKVRSVKIIDPDEDGATCHGSGRLIIKVDADDFSDDYAEIEQAIAQVKGPGILAEIKAVGAQEYAVHLVLQPVNSSISRKDSLLIAKEAKQIIIDSFAKLNPGDSLLWNRVLVGILAIDGVLDIDSNSSHFLTGNSSLPLANLQPVLADDQVALAQGDDTIVISLLGEKYTEMSLQLTTGVDLGEEDQLAIIEYLQPFVAELDINTPLLVDDIWAIINNNGTALSELEIKLTTPENAEITLYPTPVNGQVNSSKPMTYQLAKQEYIRLKKQDPLTVKVTEVSGG